MNRPIVLTRPAFDSVVSSLLEIEEGIEGIIEEYLLPSSAEADEFRQILNDYVRRLDGIIPNITVDDAANNDFPCAVIGSEVTVEDVGSGETYCCQLISPLKNRIDYSEISFLSPLGKGLLLRKINEQFVVATPRGSREYKVLSVRIMSSKNSIFKFTWMKSGK